jgi:hypothetical protein
LKSKSLKSKRNKRDEDVVAEEETEAKSLPLLPPTLKATAAHAMIRLVPPFRFHQMIHPLPHPQNNINKNNEETTTKENRKST